MHWQACFVFDLDGTPFILTYRSVYQHNNWPFSTATKHLLLFSPHPSIISPFIPFTFQLSFPNPRTALTFIFHRHFRSVAQWLLHKTNSVTNLISSLAPYDQQFKMLFLNFNRLLLSYLHNLSCLPALCHQRLKVLMFVSKQIPGITIIFSYHFTLEMLWFRKLYPSYFSWSSCSSFYTNLTSFGRAWILSIILSHSRQFLQQESLGILAA